MIYLRNTTDAQTVRIPASSPKAGGIVTLEMVNVINRGAALSFDFDQAVYLADADGALVHDAEDRQIAVADRGDSSRLYYVLTVELPEGIPEGEYEYTARIGGDVVSCGLAIVGEPAPAVASYDKPVQYEQYNAN